MTRFPIFLALLTSSGNSGFNSGAPPVMSSVLDGAVLQHLQDRVHRAFVHDLGAARAGGYMAMVARHVALIAHVDLQDCYVLCHQGFVPDGSHRI